MRRCIVQRPDLRCGAAAFTSHDPLRALDIGSTPTAQCVKDGYQPNGLHVGLLFACPVIAVGWEGLLQDQVTVSVTRPDWPVWS